MRISWIWSQQGGLPYGERNREEADSFRRHKDSMKRFRQSHPKIEAPKPKEEAETIRPKNLTRANWVGIIPMPRVQLARYSQN